MFNPSKPSDGAPLRVLAIDSALDQSAVAIYDADLQIVLASRAVPMQRGHAEMLLPMIEEVLGAAGIGFSGLDRIAVTIGPGSFTGLRIGISAARGLALALSIPVVGVSTFAAFAAPFIAFEPRRPVAVILDAKNAQAYLQEFDSEGTALAAPLALPLADVPKALVQPALIIIGTAAQPVLIPAKAQGKDVHLAPCGPGPDIAMVARLGALADADSAPPRPLYVRPPSASVSTQPGIARA
jgi:tRNA threonylcarbamoyladenosine biosynthesis protein TsaB